MKTVNARTERPWSRPASLLAILSVVLPFATGCWAPLHSPGIPAASLPDSYRIPIRTAGPPLNFSSLTIPPPEDYILGPNDMLEVVIHGLYPGGDIRPVRAQVMASGEVHLPVVGGIKVAGMNLMQAHVAITKAYADGFIKDPRTNVYLMERSTTSVLVLGEVAKPGNYHLPKYENDVAHAIAMAGGLSEDAGREIQVHRRVSHGTADDQTALLEQLLADEPGAVIRLPEPKRKDQAEPEEIESSEPVVKAATEPGEQPEPEVLPDPEPVFVDDPDPDPKRIVTIPLHGHASEPLHPEDIVLNSGDVVVVPSRRHELFYVVGPLSPTNFVRFTVGGLERDLGVGLGLPRDREIDVVTAVVMAGYIHPIESPTTVTLQRKQPDGTPMLIHVDLMKARSDPQETVLVQAGDIIYLNPDLPWWTRRTLDRVVDSLITIPYARWINPP